MSEFRKWLTSRLGEECDTEVIVPYIVSVLEDDEDEESVDSLLMEMIGTESANIPKGSEIIKQWKGSKVQDVKEEEVKDKLDLQAAMSEIAESKSSAYRESIKKDSSSTTDATLKAAIIAACSGRREEESEEESGSNGAVGLAANTNADSVARAETEKREKARASAAAKKEKDKEDRENQKKSQEDRKKKAQEKAAKGERRR